MKQPDKPQQRTERRRPAVEYPWLEHLVVSVAGLVLGAVVGGFLLGGLLWCLAGMPRGTFGLGFIPYQTVGMLLGGVSGVIGPHLIDRARAERRGRSR